MKLRSRSTPRLHLKRFLPYRLSVLANTVSSALAAKYSEEFDLTTSQWRVIAVLGEEENLSGIDVAERTAMDKVSVSRAVQALIAAGRVLRSLDAKDRRRSILRLSARGRSIYQKIVPLAGKTEAALLATFSPTDLKNLDRLLAKLWSSARNLNDSGNEEESA